MKLYKVKMFAESNIIDLEKEINNFLLCTNDIILDKIEYQTIIDPGNSIIKYTAMILYTQNINLNNRS